MRPRVLFWGEVVSTCPFDTLRPGVCQLRAFRERIGQPREAEYYLSSYRAQRRERFAVIAVSDAVMRDAAAALILDLRLLAQMLDGLHAQFLAQTLL